MKSQLLNGRWVVAFLITAFVLCITPAIPAQACEEPPDDEHDGPVYLILSLEEEFDTPVLGGGGGPSLTTSTTQPPPQGSKTIIIEIGTYIAGSDIGGARFDPTEDLGDIVLPCDCEDCDCDYSEDCDEEGCDCEDCDCLELEDLDGYQITILGAFDTFPSEDTVHLVAPDPGDPEAPMSRKVQEAFFLASPDLDLMEPQFPTTVEIAQFIFDFAVSTDDPYEPYFLGDQSGEGGEGPLTVQAILDNIFVTEAVMECPPEGDVACEAEGDLFPHDPDEGSPLFNFDLQVAGDGDLEIEVVYDLNVDIKPGSDPNSVNLGSKGVLPVAILGTENALEDVTDIDEDTILIGGVAPAKSSIEDVNDDGYDDLILHFKVPELVDDGALDEYTEKLTVVAELVDGTAVRGSDSVRIVPPKGKKNKK